MKEHGTNIEAMLQDGENAPHPHELYESNGHKKNHAPESVPSNRNRATSHTFGLHSSEIAETFRRPSLLQALDDIEEEKEAKRAAAAVPNYGNH